MIEGAMMDHEVLSRLVKLEANEINRDRKLDEIGDKVDEMYEVIIGARGIKWFALTAACVIGFVLGNIQAIKGLFQ